MKNKQIIFLLLILFLICTGLACQKSAENSNMATNQAKTNNKRDETPAIEITAEALAKEWLANPAETDNKYKGKILSVTGEVYTAQKIGDQFFVDVLGEMFDAKTRGAKITCVSGGKDDDAPVVVRAREINEKMIRENPGAKMPPPPKVTIKGTYSRSAPPNDPAMAFIDLTPCTVLMF